MKYIQHITRNCPKSGSLIWSLWRVFSSSIHDFYVRLLPSRLLQLFAWAMLHMRTWSKKNERSHISFRKVMTLLKTPTELGHVVVSGHLEALHGGILPPSNRPRWVSHLGRPE